MTAMDMSETAKRYFELQNEIEQLTAQAEDLKDQIKMAMYERDTETLEGPGWRATWHNTTTHRFDSKRFQRDHADLYGEYSTACTGTRFTLNAVKA